MVIMYLELGVADLQNHQDFQTIVVSNDNYNTIKFVIQ